MEDAKTMEAAGPGAVADEQIAPRPLLEQVSEYEYVTIHNPLPVPFVGQVAASRPVNAPVLVGSSADGQVTEDEADIKRNYGLNLRNKDFTARAHVVNQVSIPANGTINLLGHVAQVVVRQLVNEIMQREGKSIMLHDAYQRSLVEERIVKSRRPVSDISGQVVSIQDQLEQAVDALNEQEQADEPEFPDLQKAATQAAASVEPERVFVQPKPRRTRAKS